MRRPGLAWVIRKNLSSSTDLGLSLRISPRDTQASWMERRTVDTKRQSKKERKINQSCLTSFNQPATLICIQMIDWNAIDRLIDTFSAHERRDGRTWVPRELSQSALLLLPLLLLINLPFQFDIMFPHFLSPHASGGIPVFILYFYCSFLYRFIHRTFDPTKECVKRVLSPCRVRAIYIQQKQNKLIFICMTDSDFSGGQ